MQILEDKQKGRITEDEYEKALRFLDLKRKTGQENALPSGMKKPRKKRIKTPESEGKSLLRNALRAITKWFFDGEIYRQITPLFVGAGDSEKLVKPVFAKIVKQVIDLSSHNHVVASQKSRVMVDIAIEEIVTNRRRNVRNSKKPAKPGAKPRKPLKSIYESKKVFYVSRQDGSYMQVPKPRLLPNSTTTTTTVPIAPVIVETTAPIAPVITDGTNESIVETTTPIVETTAPIAPVIIETNESIVETTAPIAEMTAPIVPVITETTVPIAPVISEKSTLRKDVVEVKIKALQVELNKLKQEKEILQSAEQLSIDVYDGESRSNWQNDIDELTIGGAVEISCFGCGKDCLISLAKPIGKYYYTQHTFTHTHTTHTHTTYVCISDGTEKYCELCWKKQEDQWMRVSSLTGSRKRKAPKAKKSKSKKPKVKKSSSKKSIPSTPKKMDGKRTGTTTPPLTKYKVYSCIYLHCLYYFTVFIR